MVTQFQRRTKPMTQLRRFHILVVFVAASLAAVACSSPEDTKRQHMQRGDEYVKSKKYNEAIIEYRNVVQMDPKFGEARRKLADAYLGAGDAANGYREYIRAADLLPDDIDVQITAGGLRLLANQFDDAKAIAEKILARDASNVRALVLRGNALAGLKNVPDAVADIEEAIKLDPKGAALYTNLGALEVQRRNLPDAEAAFKRATTIAPQSAPAFSALGNFYFSANRLPEAEQAFKRAVELDPLDTIAHRALAGFYFATHRRADAEAPLQALAAASKGIAERLTLADYYLLGGQTEKGVAILNDVARQREGAVPAKTRLAAVQYTAGNRAEAHKIVDALLIEHPAASQPLLLKAKFLFYEQKNDEALERAKAAIKADARSAQGYFLVGEIELARQHNLEATQAFTEVLRINPRAAAAQVELSRLQLALGNAAGAVQSAEQAVKSAPLAIEPRLALTRSLLARGDVARAATELKALEQKHGDNSAVIAMTGDLYLARKDYAKARERYKVAYAEDPKSNDAVAGLIALDLVAGKPADAHAKMDAHLARVPPTAATLMLAATTYAATRDMPKTEAVLRKAIEVDPSNLQAYGTLGQFYYAQGRLADGRTEFENLVKRDPNSIAANTMLGIILERQGHLADAQGRYEKVLAVDSRAAVAANNLAWIYATRGEKLDEALQLAQTASMGLPDRAEVADTLAWVYQKKGLPTLAVPLLKQVVDRNPQNAQYRYHLGAALASSGNADDAKKELQRALQLSQDFPEAAEARRLLGTLN
jgi:tetratricopeptide (TPR) repeat protein